MVSSSNFRLVKIAATSRGWEKYGIAIGTRLLAVLLHGIDIGLVQKRFVSVFLVLLLSVRRVRTDASWFKFHRITHMLHIISTFCACI